MIDRLMKKYDIVGRKGKCSVTISISRNLDAVLKAMAEERSMSYSSLVSVLVVQGLKNYDDLKASLDRLIRVLKSGNCI